MFSEEAFRRLPMWVAVGFAARCARLVLPHFKAGFTKLSKKDLEDVVGAVEIAEEFAYRGAGRENHAAKADGDHAIDVGVTTGRRAEDNAVVAYADAAGAAAYAAGCAADVAKRERRADIELVYSNATRAVLDALTCPAVDATVQAEFERLAGRAAAEKLDPLAACPRDWIGPSI